LIWGAGLVHAVWGGLNPGFVSHPAGRPYPVRGVLTVCGVITGEFGLLFAIIIMSAVYFVKSILVQILELQVPIS
jgi:hypothetical protein